jgi:hypothetical protein
MRVLLNAFWQASRIDSSSLSSKSSSSSFAVASPPPDLAKKSVGGSCFCLELAVGPRALQRFYCAR